MNILCVLICLFFPHIVTSTCGNNPCMNGGTCTDNNGQADCTCPPGFTGELCQIRKSEELDK